MYYGYYYDPTMILLVIAMVFTLWAQFKVQRAYSKFARVPNQTGMTGMMAARRILDANGLNHVRIEMTQGRLSDHYDPRGRVMRLSPEVYSGNSVAAVSIAAHESGHAIQHGTGYGLLTFRNTIVPVVNFASKISWILILIGIIIAAAGSYFGSFVFDIGILFFLLVVLFHLVTLPVELNASKRAVELLQQLAIIGPADVRGSKKVLSAAAMTYVAALATAVLELIRLLLIRERE
jgi:Zn-dependent membrane protease YugP